MENEFVEPEERNNIEDASWNPLDEPVNEKAYTASGFSAAQEDLTKPIGEPRFTPPPFKKAEQPKEKVKPTPMNPEFETLSKKDAEMSAQHAAEMIMGGYEWIHGAANKYVQVSEKKLDRLQEAGEINLNAMISYDYGKEMRAGQFFKEYNTQVSNMFVVSDEFKEETTPLLTKVLAKRGVGMTDEQRLAFYFAKDFGTKAIMFFQQKRTINDMINSIKEATVSSGARVMPPPIQPIPPQQEQRFETPPPPIEKEESFDPPPPPPPSNKGTIFEDEDFVNTKTPSIKPDSIIMPIKKRGRPSKR
jgi:hypothetical protein